MRPPARTDDEKAVAVVLIGAEPLIEYLGGEDFDEGAISGRPLADIAVSAVTFEWLIADAESDPELSADARGMWRTNLNHFRKQLEQSGGECPALTHKDLSHWGKLLIADLEHKYEDGEVKRMPNEERLAIATALEFGYIYFTKARDWNAVLQSRFRLSLQTV